MPRSSPAFYPVVAAIYPVLALAAKNRHEAVRLQDLLLPLGVSLAVVAVGWLMATALVRSRDRRAILTSAIVVAFVTYGFWLKLIAAMFGIPAAAQDLVAGGAVLVGLAGVYLVVRAAPPALPHITRWLNTLALVLLAFLTWELIDFGTAGNHNGDAAPHLAGGRFPALVIDDTAAKPDIYLIVLDSYSSNRSLKRIYQHDNGDFQEALTSRNFVVPSFSQTNYVMTFLGLAAMLNWDYLQHLGVGLDPDSRDRSPVFRMIEQSRTVEFLRRRGYKFVFFPTPYAATSRNRFADTTVSDGSRSAFVEVWVRTTPLGALGRWATTTTPTSQIGLPFEAEGAFRIRRKLDQLVSAAAIAGPKFVFVHLMVPHEPFIFSPECEPRQPYWPRSRAEDADWREAYVAQVSCVNQLLIALVDSLDAMADGSAVILLQGDHGHGRFPLGRAPLLSEVTSEQIADRMETFAAYRLPNVSEGVVYDGMSGVNLLRMVLREYFGAPLPPLPDRGYWSSVERPYVFTVMKGTSLPDVD